ncbi:hypothetical protein J6590_084287 [Homalodisca vitripennis]|nr:hypothetical protein J6590_084287 [Homalodisca vitripennis]
MDQKQADVVCINEHWLCKEEAISIWWFIDFFEGTFIFEHVAKPKRDSLRNKAFNNALKEAGEAYKCNQSLSAAQDPAMLHDPQTPKSQFDEINSKVQNLELLAESDLETSLTLAAEAGNYLLHENYQLQQKIHNIEEQNIILDTNASSMEAKIEELLNAEEKYLNRIESLQEKLQEALTQLEKNKAYQADFQNIFEEHDQKQNKFINESLSKIKNLEKINTTLSNQLQANSQNLSLKLYSETGTQTHDASTTPNSSSFLIELTQLKKRQDEMEQTIKMLLTSSANSLKKLPDKEKYTEQSSKKRRNTCRSKNVFSISLQVAKAKNNANNANTNTLTHDLNLETRGHKTAESIKPSHLTKSPSDKILSGARTTGREQPRHYS